MPSLNQQRAANTPRLRTRRGCWTCRRRRRKCDEEKPRCQNCIVKDLKCNYGVQLTFRDANLSGLDADEARALRKHSSQNYERLQFVDRMDDIQEDLDQYRPEEDEKPLAPTISSIARTNTRQSAVQNDIRNDADRFHHQNLYAENGGDDGSQPDSAGAYDSQTTTIEQGWNTAVEPSAADGIRLNVDRDNSLSRTYSAPIDPALMQDIPGSVSYSFTSSPLVSSRFTGTSSGSNLHSLDTEVAELTSTSPSTSHSITVDTKTYQDLLKLFIDQVAPWLDLCTPNASYSIHVPIMSSRYDPLRQAVSALAAYHSSDVEELNLSTTLIELAIRSLGSDIDSGREEPIAARHLIYIAQLLPLPMQQWRSVLTDPISTFNQLELHGHFGDVRDTACWLMLRFDLAAAIASKLPLISDVNRWHRPASPSSPPSHLHSSSISHLQESLLLCARVANLISQPTHDQAKLNSWAYLYSQLQNLQSNQSAQMILPLLTSSIGGISSSKTIPSSAKLPTSFPLYIHTSRVSFYASFLSHLISLLLIQSKPRNVDSRAVKGLKTTPWHGVQMCGLTLSNPLLWSWDPVVVAALIYAGLTLSYAGQQKELLDHLRSLERITGWVLEQELQHMEEIWRASC